jgi:hypothetical protein
MWCCLVARRTLIPDMERALVVGSELTEGMRGARTEQR